MRVSKKIKLILRLKEAMERVSTPVNATVVTSASTLPQKYWEALSSEDALVPQPNNPLWIVDTSRNRQN